MGAANNEVLKWNGANWAPAADAGGTAYSGGAGLTLNGTAFDVDNLLGEVTGPTNATVIANNAVTSAKINDGTIEEADINDDAITPVKISDGLDNQVLQTISGNTSWTHLTAPLNTGSILFSDGAGGITEDNNQLFWNNTTLRLGVGIPNPDSKLHVNGQIRASTIANGDGSVSLPSYRFQDDLNSGMWLADVSELAFSTNSMERVRIIEDGNVGIGTNAPQEKLHVVGNIRAEGAITASGLITESTPDYVFQKYFLGNSILNPNYEFKELSEIEKFVKENNHLPDIKSAAAIKKQGFWDLGEASRINLEKIEELFLHTIEQEKKIKELESTNKNMASEVEALKAQMEEIKKLLLEKTKE